MIPALAPRQGPASLTLRYLEELRLRGFEGDITHAHADRTVFATDNSIYQRAPQAIVFPRNTQDVVRVARLAAEPRYSAVHLAPRGGGTGTNGQSLTDGVAVDLSRHMHAILEVNVAEGWARVQAGVVKDQLNAAVEAHGLFFAPELSPSNRATIGGMIATDASGQGSMLYGKTRDHVIELELVLMDGTRWRSQPLSSGELELAQSRADRVGTVYTLLDSISRDDAGLIEACFPKLNRCVTGYDLAHLRDRHGRFDLNAVICGAEGTLAFVTEAKVRLTRVPRCNAVLNIRYATFDAALRDAGAIVRLQAASVETVDATVLRLARQDAIWLQVRDWFPDDPQGPAGGLNIVELVAADEVELQGLLARVRSALDANALDGAASARLGYTVAHGHEAVAAIWAMRKKAVGLLGNMQGPRRPVPFVEDTVVPPECLADYIREFRALLDRRGLSYGMFGHVDAGCLHVRPALDLSDPQQEGLVREITDEVFALARKYGGVLWGEHGKGLRSEYAPEFFGPLYGRMQQVKAAFDPDNQLNPGKIAAPPGRELTRLDAVPMRGRVDRMIPLSVRQANADSLHCNGNGACFNYDPDDAMCPSWKVTRERRHSPKGRASLMREWLQLLATRGIDPSSEARSLRALGPLGHALRWPRRALNTLGPGQGDFSTQVKEAMDGCLACKACVGQCPIKVDVPAFRSRFLEIYHGRYLRPLRHGIAAHLEALLPHMARAPSLSNALTHGAPGRAATRLLGLVDLPRLALGNVRETLERMGVHVADAAVLAGLSPGLRQRSVVVVQDAFTSHYAVDVVTDFCELLQRLGFQPWLAPFMPNGKPQHVLGMLGKFERTAARNAALLRGLAATGVSLVGVDPAMALSYRSEYPRALGEGAVPPVALPQEWLLSRLREIPARPEQGAAWAVLPHCTERTNAPSATADWITVLAHLGVRARVLASGCCGMAGFYGHERAHRESSRAIYDASWRPILAQPLHLTHVAATGYSCRCQVAAMEGRHLPHPVQVMLHALRGKPLS